MKKLSELLLTEAEIEEKAVSKKQQKFFGMVHAAQKGEKPASKEVAKVAGEISKKDADDFASTKHKGLPEKKEIKEENSFMKNNPLLPPDNIKEGDQGEVDHGMYAGGANPSQAFGKGTPEHAPVMETELEEISTGLARRAMDSALTKYQDTSDVKDPIGRAKSLNQSHNFRQYIDPELQQFLKSKGMNAEPSVKGVILKIPSEGGKNYQIEIRPKSYEFIYGNEQTIDPSLLSPLPKIIQRIQKNLAQSTPAPNELEEQHVQECSTVKKKIRYRMTQDQKDMLEEIRLIKENINKLEKGKKLLY